MMILGVDGGNKKVKIVGAEGAISFPSVLGEYRERRLESRFSDFDMEYEFKGEKGFAGTLAENESYYPRNTYGDSKYHEDFLIRVLLGLSRYDEKEFKIVVGQPISKHKRAEKVLIRQMLAGEHTIIVNGEERRINISGVEVAPEGCGAFYSSPKAGIVRIIDVGSGTINLATIKDGNYLDRESTTLQFGTESNFNDELANLNDISRTIKTKTKSWLSSDMVLTAGGIAGDIIHPLMDRFPLIQQIQPKVSVDGNIKLYTPVFANAVGFYNIARKVYANAKV